MPRPEDPGLTYRDAGVDIEAADRMVERIAGVAKATHGPGVMAGLGGFGALFSLKEAFTAEELEDPVLVSGTDGVGTKLKIAFATGVHDTVGIDLVAMCVNDILTSGARPLFFLDYFGTGRLQPAVGEAVVRGVAEGCRRAQCALVGGETAELPGLYEDGEYDLAGFAVGLVDRSAIIDGRSVRPGHQLLGVASSGIHSNGLSLARKVLLEHAGLDLRDPLEGGRPTTVAEALLEPTTLYTDAVVALKAAGPIEALAHITGGGIPGNLPRVLTAGVVAVMERDRWDVPSVFGRIAELGRVQSEEMDRTFNMGLGLVAVLEDAEAAAEAVRSAGYVAQPVGYLRARKGEEPQVEYR